MTSQYETNLCANQALRSLADLGFKIEGFVLDCKFAYSSTREQSNKRSGMRLKTEIETGRVGLSRFARVRLLRHALPISLLILRKKPTVLQSRFVCKRFLPSPPSPPSSIFWLSFHFSRGQNPPKPVFLCSETKRKRLLRRLKRR